MKTLVIIIYILLTTTACQNIEESPLPLLPAAEPSASKHNNFGIIDFTNGHYKDAFLHFKQAYAADKTSGEIYFNLGLTLHARGKQDDVEKQFKMAIKYAQGNPLILQSKLLYKYLNRKK